MHAWLQTCGCLSEGSKRATNFYELEAQVKGGSSLEESLVSIPSPIIMIWYWQPGTLCGRCASVNDHLWILATTQKAGQCEYKKMKKLDEPHLCVLWIHSLTAFVPACQGNHQNTAAILHAFMTCAANLYSVPSLS